MTCRVGTSGWQYSGWRGDFYPEGLAVRRQLSYLAERLPTVELNGTFYSLQRPASFARWRDAVPDDFVFALKGGRFITHLKRLRDVSTGLANFFASGPLVLGPKLGPILWQLPSTMTFDEVVMREFLDLLPASTVEAAEVAGRHDRPPAHVDTAAREDGPIRHVIEVRHRSFDDDRFFALLRERHLSCVVSDSPTWPLIDRQTSDLVYVRLHGHTDLYASGYSAHSLDVWARRCRTWSEEGRTVLVYFDNDARGRAPHDAVALQERLSPG